MDLALIQLDSQERLGVDTESSGYYTYFSELCLIQISAGDFHFVIDPLADLKLDRLGEIFADPSKTKIFHSAPSDITELKRSFNWNFSGIFDTFLACRMLGNDSCSLAGLVQKYCDRKMEKGEQKSNWKKRPLTPSQLKYAYLDTAYLERLMDALIVDLKSAGLYEEYLEEVEWESKAEPPGDREFQADSWIKIPGALALSPELRGRLRIFCEIRDQVARKRNIASFRILSNKALLELVSSDIQDMEGLRRFRGFNPSLIAPEGPRFIKALSSVELIEDANLPPLKEEMPREVEDRFFKLKKWRHSVANRRKMDPSVILNNRVLKDIAEKNPDTVEGIRILNLMSSGKIRRYGEEILQQLQKSHSKPG